jgi:hypothetical protein
MYISEIHIRSFRHLDDLHLGPFKQPPSHSDLIVLAGPNAGGKTSVLELLGYALSNTWSLSWSLGRSFPTNSFEVAIGITSDEVELVSKYVESAGVQDQNEVIGQLERSHVYYRAYNFSEGRYQENSTLHNRIHNLVTNALRNHYSRSLGFFLKSDRHYPTQSFNRNSLFEYTKMIQLDHIWNTAFNTSEVQYRDMYDFLVQQRYHYFRRLGSYHHRLSKAGSDLGDLPTDPLEPYDMLLQRLFPGYTLTDIDEEVPSNLFVKLISGDAIPFGDLSSGEKEVFFILSFFLRHDVSNAVIVIDEPELHLHPEFARLLVRTMQSIKPGNQIWLATHNTEIIDEAGRDRVIYLARDPQTHKCTMTLGTDEAEEIRQLKNMFGYSGYIGVARNIVFLEGTNVSSDRKMFTALFPEYGSRIKFVPCESSENLARINAAILSILEANIGWMQFYLIRDRDYLTPEIIKKYKEHHSGRMYVLDRHEIENYLLEDEIIAKVQSEIFGQSTKPEDVRNKLISIARRLSGEVLRDIISFRLNLIYKPQDFSLGSLMENQPVIDSGGDIDDVKIEALRTQVRTRVEQINSDISDTTTPDSVDVLISHATDEVRQAINDGSDGWKLLFPGKRLLEEYARSEGLGKPPALQNSLIKELATNPEKISSELRHVISIIANGDTFVG